MRADLGIDAFFSQAQALHGMAADKMLLDNRRCIFRMNMAVPDCFWINDDCWPMFALVKTAGLIDSDFGAESCCLYKLLQLGVQFAFSICRARRPGSIGGAGIVADKNVVFKAGQAVFLLGDADFRLKLQPAFFPLRAGFPDSMPSTRSHLRK